MRVLITLMTVAASAFAAVSSTGSAAVGDPPCAPTNNDTVWRWPLERPDVRAGPTVLRPFEPPAHRWDAGHRGVDLAGRLGDPVRAAGSGVVLYAGRLVDRGVVVIGHGVLRTSYEPVASSVPVGATVAPGEQVGTLEAGHCAASPCLHWGLLSGHGHGTAYFDPLLLLGCGQVRLEPVMAGPGTG
ncbi:M23 family metallopeptidase [Actinospica sp. MGRD01-02]|uniref:M23 family metallopeptidase n=1 Tax=Actinospica acidithermotolerans TaxID=2828514 RepID=A0A941IGQ2_9ACTN|nr:M23 family metallopeptidase [Actinospica acidithermotolerans]MBR7824892.1 M23 family metallopeptidase [Actinospica acidithermotolerans]